MNNDNLFDEYLDLDKCEVINQFFLLVDSLMKDIQHLEVECVRTRYKLSTYLNSPEDEFLQLDILSDLGRRYRDNPAYQIFMIEMYGGGDPMEFREWADEILTVAKGKDSNKY